MRTAFLSSRSDKKHARQPARAERLEPRTLLSGFTLHALAVLGAANLDAARGQIVQDANGDIFFLALENNSSNLEAVGELAKGASTPTIVATFEASASDDVGGLAIDGNGDLFGTTSTPTSTVWEIVKGSNTITPLATLTNATTGSDPPSNRESVVVDAQGNIFGVAQLGGTESGGTVWELPAGSGTAVILASFAQSVSDNDVSGITIDSQGNLYGTISEDTVVSGAFGAVWELPEGGSSINILASFDGANGSNPFCPLVIDSNGDVFGETQLGGNGFTGTTTSGMGTLFEIPSGSNSITPLFDFSGADGEAPLGGLAADASGDLFGNTGGGGNTKSPNSSSGSGVVYELPKGASAPITLVEFDNASTGTSPHTNVLLDSSGDVIGINGSAQPALAGGTVFELAPGSSGGGGGGSSSLTPTLSGKLPSSAIAGQKVSINETLTLTASGGASNAQATIKFFLSTSTTVDSSSNELGSPITKTIKLRKGAHISLKFASKSLPSSVPDNTYHLVAQVTENSGNSSVAASSKTITVAPPQIDLTGAFSRMPIPGKGGRSTLSFTVKNLGTTPADGPLTFNIDTSPDGELSDATVLSHPGKTVNIKAKKSTKITESLTLPAGSYFLLLQLDPLDHFQDVNLANNIFTTGDKITVA
jgi:hypothetical protein